MSLDKELKKADEPVSDGKIAGHYIKTVGIVP